MLSLMVIESLKGEDYASIEDLLVTHGREDLRCNTILSKLNTLSAIQIALQACILGYVRRQPDYCVCVCVNNLSFRARARGLINL